MAGRLVIVKRYERADIRAYPGVLVTFGDNLERLGLAGQAGAARGEPNAVGIPTKHGPWRTKRRPAVTLRMVAADDV
jgi:hypothetical protein